MRQPNQQATLASGDYLPVVRDFALSRGITPSDLLIGSDLSASDFIHPPAMISNFVINKVGENLYKKLDEPLSEAIHYGMQVRSSSHGALGIAIQTSHCLRDGLQLLSKFYATRLSMQFPKIDYGEDLVTISLITNIDSNLRAEDVQRFFDLSTMVSMVQSIALSLSGSLTQTCNGTAHSPTACISIDAPEPDGFPHTVTTACSFKFGASQMQMTFPSFWLDLPFESANKDICRAAISQCEDELKQVKPNILVEHIRLYLMGTTGPLPSIDELASKNFMSTATLKRRLKASDCCYQTLKDEIRLDKAKRYLSDGNISIETIALELGFSDNANFTKFFKRHTGATPKQFRVST